MNWIARLDVFVLALMLVYIVIVVSRSSYRCHLACRQSRAFVRDAASAFRSGAFDDVLTIAAGMRRSPVAAMVTTGLTALASVPSQFTLSEAIDTASRAFHRGQRTLAADLRGTCFGILSAFRGFGMQKQAALAMMTTYIAASLITTATGLIVAVPAVWSYNYLRVRIDRLESEMSNMALEAITQLNAHFAAGSKAIDSGVDAVAGAWKVRREDGRTGACSRIASKLPLTKQFSKLPAFALIAAPSLASVLAAFTAFSSFHTSKGLEVRVLELGALEKSDDFSAKPIFIGLAETRMNGQTTVYVNSKKTPWDNLESTVRNELKIRPQSIVYVEAENNVAWADVAKVIDAVEALPADVVLLTIAPKFNSNHTHRSGKSMK